MVSEYVVKQRVVAVVINILCPYRTLCLVPWVNGGSVDSRHSVVVNVFPGDAVCCWPMPAELLLFPLTTIPTPGAIPKPGIGSPNVYGNSGRTGPKNKKTRLLMYTRVFVRGYMGGVCVHTNTRVKRILETCKWIRHHFKAMISQCSIVVVVVLKIILLAEFYCLSGQSIVKAWLLSFSLTSVHRQTELD